jgi:hypothetical protein
MEDATILRRTRPLRRAGLLLACLASACGNGSHDATPFDQMREVTAGRLRLRVPPVWEPVAVQGDNDLAAWRVPGQGTGDARVTVGRFAGGSIEQNLARWNNQFVQDPPDNTKPSHGLHFPGRPSFSVLEVQGTYIAEKSPGSREHYNERAWRMIGAAFDLDAQRPRAKEAGRQVPVQPAGIHYVQLVGPQPTVEWWYFTFSQTVLASCDRQ